MYDLMSAIAVLPEAKETDTPTFKNTRRILRLPAYTNIKLSLHEQLVHISAAMHLMLALYTKEAGRFVPSQTYFDFMTAGKNLFFCVAKTQIDDPDGQFWIILPGSARSKRHLVNGMRQTYLLNIRSGRVIDAAFDYPVWQDVEGDVSAKIDHITPRSWLGDVHVNDVRRFSVAESRDRLKRVRGFSRHGDAVSTVSQPSDANEAIPGEPMVLVQDPAAILVRSNGFVWLAVVSISGFTCGTKHLETLPKRLLNEPNVRARVQIMELVPTKNRPGPTRRKGTRMERQIHRHFRDFKAVRS
ncbi:hypothetical protein B0H10DRAFT_2200668 [Mycena sp. CBHHK59/15]|nr:hypothetical protein B0H10DRAFT_2200668 [Mycena sp. CBHHK59/15]